jgi:L-amino acid N-acyltransferase YncA
VDITTRGAGLDDADAITRIYNEGIAEGHATFETEPRVPADIASALSQGFPAVVAIMGGEVVGWAWAPPYRPQRPAYRGVAEFSVYVAGAARDQGVGRAVLRALIDEAASRGYWKLLSRIFPENQASLALCRSMGFREVGVYRRHAQLDGEWKDCVIVELLLGAAAER